MRKTTTESTAASTTTAAAAPTIGLTRGQVEELIDTKLREALREQARNMEQHLKSIHDRLVRIETHGALR